MAKLCHCASIDQEGSGMIYQDLYWNAALAYSVGVIGFLLVMWKVGTKLPWRPLRWWLMWVYLCVVLTPWFGTKPEPYMAPMIIVAAFDFLDLGPQSSLAMLSGMAKAILAGTFAIVAVAIVLRIKALKQGDSGDQTQILETQASPED
jgi:uncharacterized membrane protein